MFPSNALPAAAVGVAYSSSFNATGGIPFYDWEISAGTLPSGLTLDSFTGALTGTPTTSGVFNFTVHVRDYHEAGVGLTQAFALSVASPPSPRLALSIAVQGGSGEAHLFLFGSAGQKQIIQASGILSNWTPMATNLAGTKIFEFIESNPLEFPQRFYRAMVVP